MSIEPFLNQPKPRNLPFEKRYGAETVKEVKADLLEMVWLAVSKGDAIPSYRSISRYLDTHRGVKISGATVKRLLTKVLNGPSCFAPTAPDNLKTSIASDLNASKNQSAFAVPAAAKGGNG